MAWNEMMQFAVNEIQLVPYHEIACAGRNCIRHVFE